MVDLADIQGRALFEIVPPGQAQAAAAKDKIDRLLLLINYAMIGVPTFHLGTDFHGEIGVRFAEGAVPWKLIWSTVAPGIVAYQWLALRVDEPSEDAYRDAYVTHRWRAVSPQEIAKFGRALHEVVERLVQAREELAQTRAAAEMPILPGETFTDYLRTVQWWSAWDDMTARFLPVMRKPRPLPLVLAPKSKPSVRRDARFIGQMADGDDGGGPQGGYTVKGKPGNQPELLHMGNAAHKIIGAHYKTKYGAQYVRVNTVSLKSIVNDVAGGNSSLLRPEEALLRPDLTHLRNHVMFEIKSSAPGKLAEAQAEVTHYITAINRAMGPTQQFGRGTDFSGDFWVRFALTMPYWRLSWKTTAPGVVQYHWQKLDNGEVDEAKIAQGIADGRFTWVDLTLADVMQYAEKCDTFAEMYVDGADKLYKIAMVTDFVVAILGDASIIFLSAGLVAAEKAQPTPRTAATSQPAPAPPPPAPSPRAPPPMPPINARSLGSDTHGTLTGSARPAAPAKPRSSPQAVAPN